MVALDEMRAGLDFLAVPDACERDTEFFGSMIDIVCIRQGADAKHRCAAIWPEAANVNPWWLD